MRIETAERRRQTQIVDAQRAQVDVERQPHAAGGGPGILGLRRLRRAQHGDLRGGHDLDAQVPPQKRAERPDDVCILDLQPRTAAVGDLDACHPQIGRHEAVDAGDRDLLVGGGSEPGGHGRQQPLARPGLYAGEGETQHEEEGAERVRRDAKRAHQKACPKLT